MVVKWFIEVVDLLRCVFTWAHTRHIERERECVCVYVLKTLTLTFGINHTSISLCLVCNLFWESAFFSLFAFVLCCALLFHMCVWHANERRSHHHKNAIQNTGQSEFRVIVGEALIWCCVEIHLKMQSVLCKWWALGAYWGINRINRGSWKCNWKIDGNLFTFTHIIINWFPTKRKVVHFLLLSTERVFEIKSKHVPKPSVLNFNVTFKSVAHQEVLLIGLCAPSVNGGCGRNRKILTMYKYKMMSLNHCKNVDASAWKTTL